MTRFGTRAAWPLKASALILAATLASTARAAPPAAYTVETLDYARAAVAGQPAGKRLSMDLYRPRACRPACPVLVALHGGSFLTGARDIDEQKAYGAQLAARGIAVASISYRLQDDRAAPGAAFAGFARTISSAAYEPTRTAYAARGPALADTVAAAVEDAAAAIRWLQANGPRLGLDRRKIGLIGASAGAEAVLDLAYLSDDNGLPRPPVGVVVSIRGMIQDDRSGAGATPFRRGDPPLFILHGTEDNRIPFAESLRLYRLAAQAEVPVELHPVGGAGHELGGREALGLRLDDGQTVGDHLLAFIEAAFAGRLRPGARRCVAAGADCPGAP